MGVGTGLPHPRDLAAHAQARGAGNASAQSGCAALFSRKLRGRRLWIAVAAIAAWRAMARAHDGHGARASPADVAEAGDRCAICQVSDAYCMTTVVPARPRSRGERRSSMRTFPSLSTNANERRALDRIGLRRPRATDRRLSPIARVCKHY